MFRNHTISAALFVALKVAGAAHAETILQEGSLDGYAGDPTVFEIAIEQFDTQGGTRQINFVRLDFNTALIGGGNSDGTGIPVHLYAQLDANYSLGEQMLAETQAIIDFVHPNVVPQAFTLFDTDSEEVVIDTPVDMEPWIGEGQITLSAWVQMIVEVDPEDLISFSAGGSVDYTVTYDYEVAQPNPGDINGDGAVNVTDLLAMLAGWGACGLDCPADLNGDAIVNVVDLLELLANWS